MSRTRTIPVFAFPVLLGIGILLIPLIRSYDDHQLVLSGVEQSARWFSGHLLAAAAFGVSIWAACEISVELHRRTSRSNAVLLVFFSLGAAVYAAGLGADGIAPLALRTAGVSPLPFFDGGFWVTGVFMLATTLFAIGLISMTVRTIQAGLVTGAWRYVVFIASLIFIAAPAVLSGYALYAEALAALGVFVPIGLGMAQARETAG
jgi:hypothetical protein